MPTVIYSPAADDDLVDIAAHIARDKPEAALRWVQTIREKMRRARDAFNDGTGETRIRRAWLSVFQRGELRCVLSGDRRWHRSR